MNINTHLRDLLDITEELAALLLEETALLRAMKPQAIEPLQSRKQLLSQTYELRSKELRTQQAALEQADPALRQKLRSSLQELDQATQANALALQAAHAAGNRVLQIIVDCAKEQQGQVQGYSPRGRMKRQQTPVTPSVSVNQQL